jgi:hypothetical protein
LNKNIVKNIRILNATPYYDMRRTALYTVGKKPKSTDSFNEEWLKKLLISRHTPNRPVFFEFEFETSKAVRDQLLRSKHGTVEPFVESSRPDRTGEPRNPKATSKYLMIFDIEGLIKMFADRLCIQTEKDTRNFINDVKASMMSSDDDIIRTVGEVLAPKCAWYGTCNEFYTKDCFEMKCEAMNGDDILERINFYNEIHFSDGGED